MSQWVRVASVEDCPEGTALELVAGDRIIALVNCEGTFHALDGVCPHQGGPLGQGQICGTTLTCPWHGWQFDVTTGRSLLSQSIVQPRLAVRTDGNDVLVDIGRQEVPPA